MPLTTQTEITLEGFDGAVTSVGCSQWQDRTIWALWITNGAATWQWKTQQRKSCNTCNSDRTPRQGMDLQRMHLVLQAPTHMPTLTHCNACPLWLEVGQISILYNWFEESSNNSSWPPNAFGWAHCGIKGAPQAPTPRNVGMLDSADMPAPDNTVTFCMTDSYTVHSLIQHHYVCLSLLPYSIEGDKGSIVDAYLWGSSTDVNSSKQRASVTTPVPSGWYWTSPQSNQRSGLNAWSKWYSPINNKWEQHTCRC